ncbi:hypothetical protein [Brevundimonas vesicularis]|uniref:hypothetical protein n=1 Tax=Brevundimonas vesicularis TaxID=41276 RepID=UPI00384D2229
MFRARTVFVIGAGASYEVGLPIGDDLLKAIVEMTHFQFDHFSKQTHGDVFIVEALRTILNEGRSVERLNDHLRAGRQLGLSAKQALSIDNVIDALENKEIELLGKLGIARGILKAEAHSTYFRPAQDTRKVDMSMFQNTWYSSFTKLLTEQVKLSQIDNLFDNVEIVNFNYDRCLEHYLPLSLSDYYGIAPEQIQALMKDWLIHRPYGLTGRLPWRSGEEPAVQFGHCGAAQLVEVVDQIRTFTEQIEEGEALDAMRAAIASADRIVFLGFAFHRQNVRLIATDIQDHTEILATAQGISKSDRGVIEDELADAFGFGHEIGRMGRIDLAADTKCNELFRNYWRTLTAAPPE